MLNHRQQFRISLSHKFDDIISVKNILAAWKEFVSGKRKKRDVQEFQACLMDNIIELHEDLKTKRYKHGSYTPFKISDPKPREIHKASVRDRLLHHAIYRILYPFFDRTWIADSFSCRNNKGTHKAIKRFQAMAFKVSKNHTRTCFVLKCDIRKFFASIDHGILMRIVAKFISDQEIVDLVKEVVGSFHGKEQGIGLPLGNLTSQLLVNIYMNEFDQFAKHKLKSEYYIRYADDFVFLSENKKWLENLIPKINAFLNTYLKISMHPDKVYIKTIASGVDFLGWVHFKDHRTLREATKRRMIRNLDQGKSVPKVQSYKGLLSHGNAHNLSTKYLT